MAEVIVIGGGFFGSALALRLAADGDRVTLLERESGLLRRASYTNQARVHLGYHYPRSLVTAIRSRRNAPRFSEDFRECIVDSFRHYYAIGRTRSNVTAGQFARFCRRIDAPLSPAPGAVTSLFNPALVEAVFEVPEHAFDADGVREVLERRLEVAAVEVRLATEAVRVEGDRAGQLRVEVRTGMTLGTLSAERVFNCTYSRLNGLLAASGMPLLNLKYELAEMLLVEPPAALRSAAVTVMCGPYFSCMPFPPRRLHTLSHVRYTPHRAWTDGPGRPWVDPDEVLARPPASRGPAMLRDAARYLPIVADCRVVESMWEVKTLLPRSEVDDSRPILFRADHGLPGFTCVTGAKLDNVYDMLESPALHPAVLPDAP